MTIHVIWDDAEKTIVRWDVERRWDANDLYKATEESIKLRQSATCPCSVILDFSRADALPANILTHLKSSAGMAPQARELVVGVTTNAFHKTIYTLFSKLNARLAETIIMVETLEQARETIRVWREAQEKSDPEA